MTILLFFYCSFFTACKNNTGGGTVTEQTNSYELMQKVIRDNDIKTFDSLMKHIPVIDSLMSILLTHFLDMSSRTIIMSLQRS